MQSLDDNFEPWSVKREGILNKYTTNEKMSITFVASANAVNAAGDKVKQRLDQLDDMDEGSVQEMQDISINDWIKK